jgi:hypothetical protein
MTRPDPIEIMTRRVAIGLVRGGMSIEHAAVEADAVVDCILDEMARLGLKDQYVYICMRRSRVYRMRSQGLTATVVGERLGIRKSQVFEDYKAELARRREAEAA